METILLPTSLYFLIIGKLCLSRLCRYLCNYERSSKYECRQQCIICNLQLAECSMHYKIYKLFKKLNSDSASTTMQFSATKKNVLFGNSKFTWLTQVFYCGLHAMWLALRAGPELGRRIASEHRHSRASSRVPNERKNSQTRPVCFWRRCTQSWTSDRSDTFIYSF